MRMTLRHEVLLLLALTLALLWAILMMLAPSVSDIDLGGIASGGGGAADSATVNAEGGAPAWVERPLEPPLEAMGRGG